MKNYLDLARSVLEFGEFREDRTGTGTFSLFSPAELRYDLRKGFPIVTTKRVAWKSVAWELLWFLRGDTNVKWLQARGVRIWNEWADDNGDLGPVYGKQWRTWASHEGSTIDQIARVCDEIVSNPQSRRLVVSAWNVADLEKMALPPCHLLFQFFVSSGTVSIKVYQRSVDIFLGLPFNIASYSLLLSIVAQITGLQPKEVIFTFGDAHVYYNHVPQMREQLSREPHALPTLRLPAFGRLSDVTKLRADDFVLEKYVHHSELVGKISV